MAFAGPRTARGSPESCWLSAAAVYQAASGLVAGSITSLLMSPFDVARTRMQIQEVCGLPANLKARNAFHAFALIAKYEGWKGFFRGFSAAGIAIPVFWATYFPIYSFSKRTLGGLDPFVGKDPLPQPIMHAASAIITAVICDTITNPLWVIRTRLQTQALHLAAGTPAAKLRYRGPFQAFRVIRQKEGMQALYKGLVASWLGASHVAIQFPLYEYLRAAAIEFEASAQPPPASAISDSDALAAAVTLSIADPSSSVADFDALLQANGGNDVPHPATATVSASSVTQSETISSARDSSLSNEPAGSLSATGLVAASVTAKLVASMFTYPHETIRARLQDQRDFVSRRYTGVLDCAVKTYRAEGLAGLYSGFSVNLLRALPAVASTFFVYEAVHGAILAWAGDRDTAASVEIE